jgi:dihydroxy-acid dehydratase
MGLSLPNNGALPAVDARRRTLAHLTGRRIVELVRQDVRLSHIATRAAFENAILAHAAIGGSTNAVIHLLAIAGRLGVPLSLDDFDQVGRETPLLADLMPSGRFLMEEFCYAGGVPAVLKSLLPLLRRDAPTVSGATIGEIAEAADRHDPEVIADLDRPVGPSSGVWVLRGNLCPQGAIIKPSAATPALLTHEGRATVFEDIEDYKTRIDAPDLEVDETSVLVLRACGPIGYPGMPEVGNMALPSKLLARGVRDLVRVSDARMSGTAYGTVILHVSPESEAGGPLGLVTNGDRIRFDGPNRRLGLLVEGRELERRRAEWRPTQQRPDRGWGRLYVDTVQQADRGCDLDFLVGASGSVVSRESH